MKLQGRKIFADLSFEIERGQHVVLTGPSGSGKTTLLRILAGLERPCAGSVQLLGKPANCGQDLILAPHKRGVALVFQDLGLWPNLTVFQNVILGMSKLGLTKTEKTERGQTMLKQCEIGHLAKRKPGQISNGEQQRVALARALVIRPEILLMDEPFGALDIVLRQKFFKLIGKFADENICCLTVTHDPFDALGLGADRLLALESGQIMDDLPANTLMSEKPKSETFKAWRRQIELLQSRVATK